METDKTVTIEGDSLVEAKAKLKQAVPPGLCILSQKTVCDGKPVTIDGTGSTPEAAASSALAKKPAGAEVTRQSTLSSPSTRTVSVDAFDEAEAVKKAESLHAHTEEVKSARLTTRGRAGFLGIGKKPHTYEVEIWQPAMIEIEVKPKAVIEAVIGMSRAQKMASLVPTFAAALDSLEPQQIERADKSRRYTKDDMLEVFLLVLIQESIGWRTYEVVGVTRRHRPCTRVRWRSSPQALRIEYHSDYADGSQRDRPIEIVRLSDKFFAFKDQYNPGTTEIAMVFQGLTGSGGTGSEPKSYYLKHAGIHDVLTDAISHAVVDKALPAFLLVMKSGVPPTDETWYVDQVIGTLVPQARSASAVQIKALWHTGEVDQATAAAALALHFRKEALDVAKYHIMLETFTDADGDGGVLVKAFEKR